LDDDQVREIVDRVGLPPRTDRTITKLPVLMRELERIREAGFAIDDGEHATGVRCVAVALTDTRLAVAISVSGPEFRLPMSKIDEIVPLVQLAGEELGKALADAEPALQRNPELIS
jgi:IclR family acetate operon transcriptional repressor